MKNSVVNSINTNSHHSSLCLTMAGFVVGTCLNMQPAVATFSRPNFSIFGQGRDLFLAS